MKDTMDLLNHFAEQGYVVGPKKVRNKAVDEMLKAVYYWLEDLRQEATATDSLNYALCLKEQQDEILSIMDSDPRPINCVDKTEVPK